MKNCAKDSYAMGAMANEDRACTRHRVCISGSIFVPRGIPGMILSMKTSNFFRFAIFKVYFAILDKYGHMHVDELLNTILPGFFPKSQRRSKF